MIFAKMAEPFSRALHDFLVRFYAILRFAWIAQSHGQESCKECLLRKRPAPPAKPEETIL